MQIGGKGGGESLGRVGNACTVIKDLMSELT